MKGLELELGAYSPSDCRHTFRDFHLEPNYPYQETQEVQTHLDEAYHQRIEQLGSFNDQFHGWVEGRRDSESVICLEAKQRLMGTLEIKWGRTKFGKFASFIPLPEVEVITCLLIRRQFYRKISGYSIGKLLGQSFTNLMEFRREGWFDVDAQQQLEFDEGTLKGQIYHVDLTPNENPWLTYYRNVQALIVTYATKSYQVNCGTFISSRSPTISYTCRIMPPSAFQDGS